MKGNLLADLNRLDSRRQVWLLAAITLAGWLAAAAWPRLLSAIGISDYGTAYLDSYAILASLDAIRAGADPHAANPLDPLMRGHVYSDWWLALRWLGLARSHNFLVGTGFVGAFGLTAWLTARSRNWGETFWLASVLVSPPVLLAIKRANNDLVIFVLLAGCGLAVMASSWWRQLIAIGCLGLATGLKYFPASAALAFLWSRPVRRMPAALLAALLAVMLALAAVWEQIERSRFVIGSGVYTMGAPLLWRDLGWEDKNCVLPGLVVILIGASVLVAGRITTGLAALRRPAEQLRAAVGAIVLLTCFLAGMNYAYRWIFVVWPAFWLWRRAADAAMARRERWVAGLGCALVFLCLWFDGAICLTVNSFPTRLSEAALDHLQFVWRRWTQPVDWLLMILLAGWLLDAGLVTVREWWGSRHEI